MKKIRPPFKLPNRPTFYIEMDRKRISLGTTDPAEANRLYKEIVRRTMAGELDKLSGRPPRKTVADFRQEYLAWSETVHRPSTVDAETLAFAHLGHDTLALQDITSQHFDLMAARLLKAGNKASSVNVHRRHLRAALGKAVKWKLIEKNPFADTASLRVDKKPPAFLPPGEIESVLKKIPDTDARLLVAAYLATGRRRSELLALRWEDIGPASYTVTLAKTGEKRVFPINKAFASILALRPREKARPFARWNHPDTLSHVVKRALTQAGVGHLRLHDLRHSFASVYLMKGGDLRSLMDLLGHTQVSTTMIYSHLSKDHLAAEVKKVAFDPAAV